MRAHGTITSSPSRRAEARTRRCQRAPSSVVEHVTFNHGVPGSIPGGPNLRSPTREELRLASHPACEGCPLKRAARRWTSPTHRSFGWQANPRTKVVSRLVRRSAIARRRKRAARGWTSPTCEERRLARRTAVARCCTAAGNPVTHRLLAKRHVCRHQRPRSRGTTVALGRPIPRVRTCQLQPVSL